MKVLITGGAGFIGSHLTERLLLQKDSVFVIDNFSTGRYGNLGKGNLELHNSLKIIQGTIVDSKLVDYVFDKFRPDVVIHAAASYKDPDDWIEDSQTNILGTINIIQAAKRVNVKKFIYFQTSLCYGLKPIEQPITVNHPLMSQGSSYAISKTVAEKYIHLSELNYIIFRLANIYGPRNLSGPLPVFYHRLTNNKSCFVVNTRRDFIYIDDLVDVLIKAINSQNHGSVYHVSSGVDYSIKELFEMIVEILGITLEVEVRKRNSDDVFTILLDSSKTNQDFNWKPIISLDTGVKSTIEWYKEYGVTQAYTHLKLDK